MLQLLMNNELEMMLKEGII